MKRQYFILVAALTLLLTSMACGILEREVAIEDVGLTVTNFENAPETSSGGGVEIASIDLSRVWDASTLRSYRAESHREVWFDGDDADRTLTVTMTIEVSSDPAIQHMIYSIEESELFSEDVPAIETEMYVVDGIVYSKSSFLGEWIAFDGDLADLMGDVLLNPQDYVILPEKAQRKSSAETVNGIPCWHYTYDESDLENALIDYEEVSTHVWIAVEGGFIVRLEFEATVGDSSEDSDENSITGMFANSRVRSTYNMTDINSDIIISLPAEAAEAEVSDLFGGFDFDSEWTREDVPFPENAEVDYSFADTIVLQIPSSVQDVKDFMLPQMLAYGWSLDIEYMNNEHYLGDYIKGGDFLSLSIDTDLFDETLTRIQVDVKRSVPWTREDVRFPQDAHIERSFEGEVYVLTYLVIQETTDFMVTQLESNGWIEEIVLLRTDTGYIGTFTKGTETLSLMIDSAFDAQGRTRIEIILE